MTPRVVLDPNVIISALISGQGPPGQILDAWKAGGVSVITSKFLLEEVEGVLLRSRFRRWINIDEIEAVMELLRTRGEVFPDRASQQHLTPDSSDDYLVALAMESAAEALVSGDPHLSKLRLGGVKIMTPREFVNRYLRD